MGNSTAAPMQQVVRSRHHRKGDKPDLFHAHCRVGRCEHGGVHWRGSENPSTRHFRADDKSTPKAWFCRACQLWTQDHPAKHLCGAQPVAPSPAVCANCVHWKNRDMIGDCRRYPPTVRPNGINSIWATTNPNDTCGEHKAL